MSQQLGVSFMIKSAQRGFTLIELVVVIIILGILAAFAVPRFMGLETEARISAVRSLGGTMQSAASMAHGLCLARGCTAAAMNIPVNNQNIRFVNQYPDANSMRFLLQSADGFTRTNNTSRFTKTGAKVAAGCWVEYVPPAAVGAQPTIAYPAGTAGTQAGAATEANILLGLRANC
jgi:MSHA pilin protein MshA